VDCEERLWNELLAKAQRRFPNVIALDFEIPAAGNYSGPEKIRVISVLQADAFMGARLWLMDFEPSDPEDLDNRVSGREASDQIFKKLRGAFVPREVLVAMAHHLGFPVSFDENEVWIAMKPRSGSGHSDSPA
jgi:hypothetical protein